jgi:hypothetical protein
MPLSFLPPAASAALAAASASLEQAFSQLHGAYLQAPTLVLALTALLILPAVALISWATQAARRYRSRRAAMRAAERSASPGLSGDMPDAGGLPARSQAWLTLDGARTVALTGQVARIGRHRDNDIRLADRSVQRRHAVIERTPDEAFLVVDVSGKGGGGVRVNGRPAERVQLRDGDVIQIGRARLRFETIRPEDIHMEIRTGVRAGVHMGSRHRV